MLFKVSTSSSGRAGEAVAGAASSFSVLLRPHSLLIEVVKVSSLGRVVLPRVPRLLDRSDLLPKRRGASLSPF